MYEDQQKYICDCSLAFPKIEKSWTMIESVHNPGTNFSRGQRTVVLHCSRNNNFN